MLPANWIKVALNDISAGGMSFDYNENLGIDLFLDLKIVVAKTMPTINCVGKTIRIEQPQPDSIFHIATEFTEISEKEKEIINRAVEKTLE